MTPDEAVAATKDAVLYLGKAFMTDPATYARGEELGFKGLEFYMVGRLGVLGDVDAEVVAATGVFQHPDALRPTWESGLAVMPVEQIVAEYIEACREWGRVRYPDDADTARLADLLERLVDGAETYGRPIFAGWKLVPRCQDAPGRVNQALFLLREQRGGSHGVAVLSTGLTPVEAMMGRGEIGVFSAGYFGWPPPYPDPEPFRGPWEAAERLTDELAARVFTVLSPEECAALAALLGRLHEEAAPPAS